jgi:hypothetical protein
MTGTQRRPGGKPGRQHQQIAAADSTGALGRRCDWGAPHPPDVEERARALALEDTGVRYSVAPGCYLREACAERRDRCPAVPEDDEGRLTGRPSEKSSTWSKGGGAEA